MVHGLEKKYKSGLFVEAREVVSDVVLSCTESIDVVRQFEFAVYDKWKL